MVKGKGEHYDDMSQFGPPKLTNKEFLKPNGIKMKLID
jgi:hypothetical protein